MEPIAVLLSCQSAASRARSALPDAPVQPVAPPRAPRRARAAALLRRAADRLEPQHEARAAAAAGGSC